MTNWKVVRMRPSTRGVKWSLSWYTSLCWGVACSAWRRIRRKEKSLVMFLVCVFAASLLTIIPNFSRIPRLQVLQQFFKWFNIIVYFVNRLQNLEFFEKLVKLSIEKPTSKQIFSFWTSRFR